MDTILQSLETTPMRAEPAETLLNSEAPKIETEIPPEAVNK
jgi:hypothetical protein